MRRAHRRHTAGRGTPAEARAFDASRCVDLPTDTLDVIRLLTTELVNNAMWHAGPGGMRLDVAVEPDVVTVGVTDRGGGDIRFASGYRWPETGHGLHIVDALSHRWGVEPADRSSGKRVWFEVSRYGQHS